MASVNTWSYKQTKNVTTTNAQQRWHYYSIDYYYGDTLCLANCRFIQRIESGLTFNCFLARPAMFSSIVVIVQLRFLSGRLVVALAFCL